ncbi:MAG: HEAT repeat domain-containing protein [Thermoguttaceae bacterium]
MARLPGQVSVIVRTGLFEQAGIGLFAVLLTVEGELYETWWNWCNPLHRSCFQDMSNQNDLIAHFFVDKVQPDRTIRVPNEVRDSFKLAAERLAKLQPWPMGAFDSARETVYREYPNVQSLWSTLDNPLQSEQHAAVSHCLRQLENASSYKEASEACSKIVAAGPSAVEGLVKLLGHHVDHVREHAARALGEIGDRRAVAHLRTRYEMDSSWEVRWEAASALGKLGEADALFVALRDREIHVRLYAAERLGAGNDDRFIEPLFNVLRNAQEDRDYRLAALHCLAKMNKPQVVAGFVELLTHAEALVRGGAADALGDIGGPSAAPSISKLLNDTDPNVRGFARNALIKIKGTDAIHDLAIAEGESWPVVQPAIPTSPPSFLQRLLGGVSGRAGPGRHKSWDSLNTEMGRLSISSRESILKALAEVRPPHWILRAQRCSGTHDAIRDFVLSTISAYEKRISVGGVSISRDNPAWFPVEYLFIGIDTPRSVVPIVVLQPERELFYCLYFKPSE